MEMMKELKLPIICCPLTGSNNFLRVIERIPVEDLISIYKRLHNVDISSEFESREILLVKNEKRNFFFFFPFKSGSSKFYDNLAKENYYNSEKEEFVFAANYVTPGSSVLDVGCGWGSFKDYIPHTAYKGLEFSQNSISKCIERGINVSSETIQGLAEKSESYDVVTAFQVLEHIENPVDFVGALKKVTRKNGLIIISVPNLDSSVVLENKPLNFPPHHISWWSKEALLYLGRKLNLERIDINIAKNPSLRPFFAVLLQWKLNSLLGRNVKVLSNNLFDRLIYKFLFFFGKIFNNPPTELLPNGHSLTIVFRK